MLVNRAKMTTATTGTGTITLGSAVDGYQTFAAAGVTDAAVVSYAIEDGTAWEIGTGTYTASGTTLSRTVTESSNAGAAINLTGNAVVFVTARAEDLATGGGAPTLATSSGASQSVDFSTSNKIHVATIDEDATLTFTNPASVAKLDLILDVLGAAYNIGEASYASKSFSVSSWDTAAESVAFKADGTKMYFLGQATDTVYQYSLSTAEDVNTASYDSVSLSVSGQETFPNTLSFSLDGTKMYVSGSASDSLHQYDLSTAWDLSTATYASKSLSFGSQDGAPRGHYFSESGLKVYMVGGASAVHQYTLTTAWDVSTGSYDGVSFSLSGISSPYGIQFSGNLTKMLILAGTSVYQYDLSTAGDVSTATNSGVSFSVASQTAAPYGFAFSANGQKMYVVDVINDVVFQYDSVGVASITLPETLQSPTVPTVAGEKTALTIVTYDGGTTYQAINVQGGIV